jgi:hypothetical protein
MATTITIPEVVLTINSSTIGNGVMNPMNPAESGSITSLFVNGSFQTASGSYVGYYNATFPLTSSADLSSSIADLDTLVHTKVIAALGL